MCLISGAAAFGISAGVGALQSVLGFAQQSAVASYQEELYKKTHKQALSAANNAWDANNARRAEERVAAARQVEQIGSEARQRRSLVLAAAADGNVSGGSVNQILRDFEQDELSYIDAVNQSESFREAQLAREQDAIRAQAISRINAARPTTGGPSPLNLALGIGSSALGAFTQFATPDPTTGNLSLFGSGPGPGVPNWAQQAGQNALTRTNSIFSGLGGF